MKTAFKIVLWSLIAITVGLSVWVGVDGFKLGENDAALVDKTSLAVCLYWVVTLAIVALLGLCYAAVTNIVCNPSGWVKTLISMGSVLVVVGASVGIALSQKITAADTALMNAHDTSELGWRLSQVGIYAMYIVVGLTVLAVIGNIVSGLVQKVLK